MIMIMIMIIIIIKLKEGWLGWPGSETGRLCSNPTTSLVCGIYLRFEAQMHVLPKHIIWYWGAARTTGTRY